MFRNAILCGLSSFYNHIDGEERDFLKIVFVVSCDCLCSLALPYCTVPWVDLTCVIVVIPDQTHLLFWLTLVAFNLKPMSKHHAKLGDLKIDVHSFDNGFYIYAIITNTN